MPSWLPKVSPDLQTDPQRLPETPRVQIDQDVEKRCDSPYIRCPLLVISARISFGAKCVEISFGFDFKSRFHSVSMKKASKKSPNIGTLPGEKNTTFSQRTLMVFLSKWGAPAAATLQRNTSILGLGGRRWSKVTEVTPLPHFTNPGYCPKRPYTHMHAGHSVLPSVSQG